MVTASLLCPHSLFAVERAERVNQAIFLIHNFIYLVLRLYLVIVIRCYFVSHPPPCATFDVHYIFLTLFPVAYSVHEVLPRLFPLRYVRRVFRAVNKIGVLQEARGVTPTNVVSMLNIE